MQYLQFYTKISSNPQLLAKGHSLIKNYLMQSPQNRSTTLTNILTPSPPILVLVGNVYPLDVYPLLHQDEKKQTRVFILDMLFSSIKQKGVKNKTVQGLMQMIRKMHNQEGYDKWLELYAQMIKNIPIQSFAQFVIAILQSADNRIGTLSINIFSYIMQSIGTYKDISLYPICTQNLLQIFYHSVKSFSHLRGTDDEVLNSLFFPYKNWLMQFLWDNIQNNPICMKYSLKLLLILYCDMGLAKKQQEENLHKLELFGAQLAQEYINIGIHSGCETYIKQQDEIQEEEYDLKEVNSPETLKKHLPVITCQLLQIYDYLIQQSKSSLDAQNILFLCILLATPCRNAILHWINNTGQYLGVLQDEFQKSIRNRANTIINYLTSEHKDYKIHQKTLVQYFQNIAIALSQGGNLALIEQFIRENLDISVKLTGGQFLAYQQASYFILASVVGQLYEEKAVLISYLINRVKTINQTSNSPLNILLKISITFVLVNQINNPYNQDIAQYIKYMVKNEKAIYQNMGVPAKQKQSEGLIIAIARGLGRMCYHEEILISEETAGDIPIQFIRILIYMLRNSCKPDEDNTHVIIQLFLQLISLPENKKILIKTGFIDSDLQVYMLQNFMHDGLLAVIVKKLLIECSSQPVIKYLTELILAGGVTIQQYAAIIVGWLKNGSLTFGNQHIQVLLQKYPNTQRSIISPIVRLYLEALIENKGEATQLIKQLLCQNPDQTWLVPMIKSGSLLNVPGALLSCIYNITYQYTSKGQIENKMLLPYYLGINNTSDFLKALKNAHQHCNVEEIVKKSGSLYEDFIKKLHTYSLIFQGKVLRLISNVFWIRISEEQFASNPKLAQYLMGKTLQLIQEYGKVGINQWQDQDDLPDLDEIDEAPEKIEDKDKYANFELHNQELETELEEIFKQGIWSWNQQFIEQKAAIFSKCIGSDKKIN